jgi:hypothetical protein
MYNEITGEMSNLQWGFVIMDMICITLFTYFYIRLCILIVKSWFNKSGVI